MAKSELAKAVDKILDKNGTTKYCQSCLKTRPIDGGQPIANQKGRVFGWRCRYCAQKKKENSKTVR